MTAVNTTDTEGCNGFRLTGFDGTPYHYLTGRPANRRAQPPAPQPHHHRRQ
jgi:hypothetical protein